MFTRLKKISVLGLLFTVQIIAQEVTDPLLINGREAKDGEFPEAVYINFGGGRCTGSVVGPRTVLSAAHCMRNGGSGRFQLGQNQYSLSDCEHHPDYRRDDVDLALCKINTDVQVAFASIPDEGFELKKGDVITIVGYGCIRPGGGGGNDGILRVGKATVSGFSGHDIVSDGSGLCFGDSGGPAYTYLADGFSGKHVQISVNSKGNIRNRNYTAITYNDTAREWIRRYEEKHKVEVCGSLKSCHEPDDRCFEEKEDRKYLQSLVALADESVNACLNAD